MLGPAPIRLQYSQSNLTPVQKIRISPPYSYWLLLSGASSTCSPEPFALDLALGLKFRRLHPTP